jgi:hypothetical protein
MKNNVNFKISDFKKLHMTLQKLEQTDPKLKIMGLSISNFLIAKLGIEDESDSREIRTKRIILQIAGDFTSKAEELEDDLKLKINLLYSDNEYSLLHMRLNRLVKEYKNTVKVTEDEVNDCTTVGDCTKLVNSKTT